jgi:hypothetical protein
MGWLVRILLIVAGFITSWFVGKDAPNFGVIQGMVLLVLIVLIVFVLALWPSAWTAVLNRSRKRS